MAAKQQSMKKLGKEEILSYIITKFIIFIKFEEYLFNHD